MDTLTCSECFYVVPKDAVSCPICGHRVSRGAGQSTNVTRDSDAAGSIDQRSLVVAGYCSQCGAGLARGARFCHQCGTPLVESEQRGEEAEAIDRRQEFPEWLDIANVDRCVNATEEALHQYRSWQYTADAGMSSAALSHQWPAVVGRARATLAILPSTHPVMEPFEGYAESWFEWFAAASQLESAIATVLRNNHPMELEVIFRYLPDTKRALMQLQHDAESLRQIPPLRLEVCSMNVSLFRSIAGVD